MHDLEELVEDLVTSYSVWELKYDIKSTHCLGEVAFNLQLSKIAAVKIRKSPFMKTAIPFINSILL